MKWGGRGEIIEKGKSERYGEGSCRGRGRGGGGKRLQRREGGGKEEIRKGVGGTSHPL